MKEEKLNEILDKLKLDFLTQNVDPDEVCAKLLVSGDIADNENDWILSSKNKTEKLIRIFDTLKQKSNRVFIRLQQISIEMDSITVYKLIQSDLGNNFHTLNLTEDEFKSYQDANVESLFFDVVKPTRDFVGREQQLMELHKCMQRSACKSGVEANAVVINEKISTITGLGGIGKTQLALMYVERYHREYGNKIVWINAESESSIRDSFLRIAQYLKLNTKNCIGKEKETPEIAKDVHAYFSKSKCLFVFDNADSTIPDELYPSGPQYKMYILITSRFQNWGEIETYQLNNFTLDEAIEFIKKVLKVKDGDSEEKDVEQLAKMLHCFPLALNQAAAYINKTNGTKMMFGSLFSIHDYIELYKTHREDLLNYKFFNAFGNKYSQTTFTIWSITINKIEESENGKLALKILNCISCLASKNINPKMFLKFDNDLNVGSAIEILQQYSMVDIDNNFLSIHPLIQEVTKLNLKQKNIEEETFTSTSELITDHFQQLMLLQVYSQFRQLLEHMELVLQAVKDWLQNNPSERKRTEQTIIRNLLENMFDGYFEIRESRQTKLILEQLFAISTEQYGHEHVEVAVILSDLGNAYGDLGDHEKSKTLLKRSLAIKEKHYGLDHFQVAITLANLGNAYGGLGDYEKQKTLLERSLVIQEKHYGLDHFQVAITLTNLGTAYGDLGDHEKSKTLLERSLAIQEKHYGLDHFQVAITLTNLGTAYGNLGNHKKSKTLLERSLIILEKHYGNKHKNVLITLNYLSNAYSKLEDQEKERDVWVRILAIQGFHSGIACDGCQEENFCGRRFKCLICFDYDLCSTCFEKSTETQNHNLVHDMMCIGHDELKTYDSSVT